MCSAISPHSGVKSLSMKPSLTQSVSRHVSLKDDNNTTDSCRTDQKEIEGRLLVFQASVQDYKMKIETWRSLVEAQQVSP